ncbi:MAG: M6 family metalloprotease domain-containing protein [Prevotella pectinovora]|uniref:M6 family metalloprotease domain-containing protein n=1 Tax=Prevotella pectinovora TaxID=1602169 RepID=UPI0025994B59|nr:M6 family metalloprotease domain-containing protein [Prevotella pectinovora]MDD7743515.1 M6 family metalloprotease domain-containing protein [Prevotella pectinovora]MDY4778157.1 M6 family metalloprotease domain-containing protein [Prevotella pectinovora]
MKRILLSISAVLAAIAIQAMPVKPGICRNITLADGTVVKAELVGDEHLTYWRTADGACYRQTPSAGVFSKVELSALQSEYDAVVAQKAAREKAILESARTSMPVKKVEGSKFQGKKKCLVILANFADTKFKPEHTLDLYKQIINGENYSDETLGFKGSVRDYFKAQSGGQFEIDFDVVGPVDLPKGYAGYGKNDASGRDQAALVYPMVEDAVNLAKDQVTDWKQYDWDGDGLVEEVFVLYAGHGQAKYPQDPDLVWPHKSAIDPMTVADGVKVSVYACSSELGATEAIDGIGAFCHEFSHCMGLKDHYDINGRGYGTGFWDIMCFGCYNGNSFLPAEYNSYEKMFCGWKEPIVLNAEPQKIEGMKALAAGGDTYIFYNDGNENEYYMLENRQKTGWDAALPGEGLIVLHVDYSKGAWEDNQVNYNAARQRMTVIPADNTLGSTDEDKAGDAWPYQGNNSLTNYSRPACTVYNANTDGTGYMNKYLLNITQNADGTISFEYTTKSATKQDKPEGALLYETFDNCSGIGGNDGIWDGDNVGLADFFPDNDGWSGTPKTGANKCALLGNATRKANAVTPSFKISEPVVISFLAAPYTGSSDNKLILAANYGCDAVLDVTEFALVPGQWTEVKANVTGSGDAAIRFKTNDKGVFIDNVCVIPVSLAGISSATADQSPKNGEIYSIDGRYMGKSVSDLRPGIYVMNGKKLVK